MNEEADLRGNMAVSHIEHRPFSHHQFPESPAGVDPLPTRLFAHLAPPNRHTPDAPAVLTKPPQIAAMHLTMNRLAC